MEPSWNFAPDWAGWLTYDEFGTWVWHQLEPEFVLDGPDAGLWYSTGMMSDCFQSYVQKQKRP